MKTRLLLVLGGVSLLLLSGCMELFLTPQYGNTPIENFEYLWTEVDRTYALFGVKGIDWDAEYATWRPQISDDMTEDELWDALTGILGGLNDNHVYLMAPNRQIFRAGYLHLRPAFFPDPSSRYEDFYEEVALQRDLVSSDYLVSATDPYEGDANLQGKCIYGTIRPDLTGSRELGYIYLGTGVDVETGFSQAMAALAETDGIVMDLRFNWGGEDYFAQWACSYFATEQTLYQTSWARNGDEHDDFDEPRSWYLEPRGDGYAGPVAVLQNAYTHSAGESMTFAFMALPHAVLIGEHTSGAYATMLWRELPNGWLFSLSSYLFTDAMGVCHEGVGTPPDIPSTDTLVDILSGTDRTLEEGIAWLLSR